MKLTNLKKLSSSRQLTRLRQITSHKLLNRLKHLTSHKWFPALVIIIITVSVYSNIFPNQFTEDENDFIVYWQDTKSWNGLPELLKGSTPPAHTSVYRPVRGVLYLLMYQTFGQNPTAYHAYSLFIHTTITLLVYVIITQITSSKSTSFIAALLFATHPIHVETITFIANSFDAFGIFLACLSIFLYLQHGKSKQPKTVSPVYIFSLLTATLAFFTYEITTVLPLMLLAYEWIIRSQPTAKIKQQMSLWLFFAADAIYFTVRFFIMQIYGRGEYHAGSFLLSILLGIKSVVLYLKLLLVPVNLSLNHILPNHIHSYSLAQLNEPAVRAQRLLELPSLVPILTIGILIVCILSLRKPHPILSLAIVWFLVALMPVMNIIPNSNIFSERYAYFASIGFCLGTAYLITIFHQRFKVNSTMIYLSILLIIVFYGYQTVQRNLVWRTEGQLYQQAIKQTPNSFLYFKLGTYYQGKKQFDLALNAYQQTVALEPKFSLAFYNLGTIYEAQNDFLKASENYQQALDIDNSQKNRLTLAALYSGWAEEYINKGDWQNASQKLQYAVSLSPENADYWHNLGSAYGQQQQWEQAASAYQQALVIDSDRPQTMQLLEKVSHPYETITR